jgi:hypothetical protein
LVPHNWGYAVASNAPRTIKENWAPEELDTVPGEAQKSELGNAGQGGGFTAAHELAAPPADDLPKEEHDDEEMQAHQSGYNCGYAMPEDITADDLPAQPGV